MDRCVTSMSNLAPAGLTFAHLRNRSHVVVRGPRQSHTPNAARRQTRRSSRLAVAQAKKGEDNNTSGEDPGPVLKAVWYAAEAFGDIVGLAKGGGARASAATADVQPISREKAMAMLREDYSVNYFISGKGEMTAYDPQCEFADPFVSFKGVDRFKKNVSNLGGLMMDVNLNVSDFETDKDGNVVTNWKFSCILNLPWKPLLAAAGGTTHIFDPESGRVIKHIERWDIEPGTVVKQLFRPAPRGRLQKGGGGGDDASS